MSSFATAHTQASPRSRASNDAMSCASYGTMQPGRAVAAQAGPNPSDDIIEVASEQLPVTSSFARSSERRTSLSHSEQAFVGLTQPKARSIFNLGNPYLEGADAMFSLGTSMLLISTGASLLAEGIVAKVSADAITGGVITGLGALNVVASETSINRLCAPLGSDAPRGLRGSHAMTNLALAAGSAMTQVGAMNDGLALELSGIFIQTFGWVGYSRTMGLICDAISERKVRTETPIEEVQPRSARSSYDAIGNPWAFAGVLIGSYALGSGFAFDSRSMILFGALLAAGGWLHNARVRNPDNRIGLLATTLGAAALGRLRERDESLLRLVAGIATGVGAIWSLYHASVHPLVMHKAHCWFDPEHLRAPLRFQENLEASGYSDARGEGFVAEEVHGARHG